MAAGTLNRPTSAGYIHVGVVSLQSDKNLVFSLVGLRIKSHSVVFPAQYLILTK